MFFFFVVVVVVFFFVFFFFFASVHTAGAFTGPALLCSFIYKYVAF